MELWWCTKCERIREFAQVVALPVSPETVKLIKTGNARFEYTDRLNIVSRIGCARCGQVMQKLI